MSARDVDWLMLAGLKPPPPPIPIGRAVGEYRVSNRSQLMAARRLRLLLAIPAEGASAKQLARAINADRNMTTINNDLLALWDRGTVTREMRTTGSVHEVIWMRAR